MPKLNCYNCLALSSVLLLLVAACDRSRSVKPNAIIKVTLAFGGGEKPAYWAVQVDSSLQYQFYGADASAIRKFKGHIERASWDSITSRLIADRYMTRVDTCRSNIDARYELVIHYASGIKRIKGCGNQLSRNYPNSFASWFAMHHNPQLQIPTTDSLNFDTHVQYERLSISR